MAQLFETMSCEMGAAHDHMIVLGRLGSEERVATFLVSTARRTGADQTRPVRIELPMTRLDMADHLGLTIETVCRTLSRFKRDGLIALEGRHCMILRRMDYLRSIAGREEEGLPSEADQVSIRPAAWPN